MTTTRINTGDGWGHPADCVPLMMAYAVADSDSDAVRRWKSGNVGNPTSSIDAAGRILRGIGETIAYQRDPPGRQYVEAPRHTIHSRRGDCKKMATVAGAVAYGLGIPFRFAVVAQADPDEPNHVWAELWTGDRWIAVDPVVRPLGLGRRVDGLVETWQPVARKGKMPMQTAVVRFERAPSNRRAIVRRAGIGDAASTATAILDTAQKVGGSGSTEAAVNTALDVATAAMATMAPYGTIAAVALTILRKIASLVQNGFHSPLDYAYRWIADNFDPKTTIPFPGDTSKRTANLAAFLAHGVVPVYCSDSAGAARIIKAEFTRRGWTPGKDLVDVYPLDKLGIKKETHYTEVFRSSECPASLQQQAKDRITRDGQEKAIKDALAFLVGAKGYFRTYGGTEDYDEMASLAAVLALPASAISAPTSSPKLPAAAAAVSTSTAIVPVAKASAPPAAPRTAPRTVVPPPSSPLALPPGSKMVAPPVVLPAGARVVSPAPRSREPSPAARGWSPGIMTSAEASVLAALRQREGIDIARRAGRAAAAYGLGDAGVVKLADAATEATIATKLPSRDKLIADRPIKTRAAQVNYGLAHIGEHNESPGQVAEKLMAYKKAASIADPPGSGINDALRGLLSASGGFPLGAVPTLTAISAKLPAGASATGPGPATSTAAADASSAHGLPAGSQQVTPPSAGAGTTPPNGGAAPLGPGASPDASSPSPTASGLPEGSQQISPPTSTASSGGGDLVTGVFLGYLMFGKKRAA